MAVLVPHITFLGLNYKDAILNIRLEASEGIFDSHYSVYPQSQIETDHIHMLQARIKPSSYTL